MGRGDQPLKAEPMRTQQSANNVSKQCVVDCASRFKTSSSSVLRSKQWPRPILQTSSTERPHCLQNAGKRYWKATEEVLKGDKGTAVSCEGQQNLGQELKQSGILNKNYKNSYCDVGLGKEMYQYERKIGETLLSKQSPNMNQMNDLTPREPCEKFTPKTQTNSAPGKMNSRTKQMIVNKSAASQTLKVSNLDTLVIQPGSPTVIEVHSATNQQREQLSLNEVNLDIPGLYKDSFCGFGTADGDTNSILREVESEESSSNCYNPPYNQKTDNSNNKRIARPCKTIPEDFQVPSSPVRKTGANNDLEYSQSEKSPCHTNQQNSEINEQKRRCNEKQNQKTGTNNDFEYSQSEKSPCHINHQNSEINEQKRRCSERQNQKTGINNDLEYSQSEKSPCYINQQNSEINEQKRKCNERQNQKTCINNDLEYSQSEKSPCHINQQNSEINEQKRRFNERQNQTSQQLVKCSQPLKKDTSHPWQTSPVNCVPENQIKYNAPPTVNAVSNQDQYCGQSTSDADVNNESNEIEYTDRHNQLLKVTNLDTVVIQPGSPTLIQVCKSRGPQESDNEYCGTCETDCNSNIYGDKQSLKYSEYPTAPQSPKKSLKSDNERYRNANKKQSRENSYQKMMTEQYPPQHCQDSPPPMMQQRRSAPIRGKLPQCKAAPRHQHRVPARGMQNYQSPLPPPEYRCAPEAPQMYRTERNFNKIPSNFQQPNNSPSIRHSAKRYVDNSQYQAVQNNTQRVPQTFPNPINSYQEMQYSNATNLYPPETNQYQDRDDCYGDGIYVDHGFENTVRDDVPLTEDQYECNAPYLDYCDVKSNNENCNHCSHQHL